MFISQCPLFYRTLVYKTSTKGKDIRHSEKRMPHLVAELCAEIAALRAEIAVNHADNLIRGAERDALMRDNVQLTRALVEHSLNASNKSLLAMPNKAVAVTRMMAHVAEPPELLSQMEALSEELVRQMEELSDQDFTQFDEDFCQDAEPVYRHTEQFVEMCSDASLQAIKTELCYSLALANSTASATPFELMLAYIDEAQTVLLCRETVLADRTAVLDQAVLDFKQLKATIDSLYSQARGAPGECDVLLMSMAPAHLHLPSAPR